MCEKNKHEKSARKVCSEQAHARVRTIVMATRDCDFRLWSYYSLQVKKRDYNIDLKLQYRGPALQLDYNPGDAITTGGNTQSALQLSGCSGDVGAHQ